MRHLLAAVIAAAALSLGAGQAWCAEPAEDSPKSTAPAEGPVSVSNPQSAIRNPQLPDITLKNVRWQELPEEVETVFIGPDQRVWYKLRHPEGLDDLAAIKKMIEGEFAKPAPQLFGAEVALFEPGGRVWFFTHDRKTILGYDGRAWVEHTLPDEHWLQGTCPHHGLVRTSPRNVWVGGAAFFADATGYHVYDGKEWKYQNFFDELRAVIGEISPLPLDDGKTLLVVVERQGIWKWQGGEWSKAVLPGPVDWTLARSGAAWGDRGVLINTVQGALVFCGKPMPDVEFATLVKRLGDAAYKVRQDATTELIRLGAPATPMVEKALAAATDPEVRVRLQKVLETVAGTAPGLPLASDEEPLRGMVVAIPPPPPPPPVKLGPYLLQGNGKVSDCMGPALLLAAAADVQEDGNSLGPGLVVAPADGEARFIKGEEIAQALTEAYRGCCGPIVLVPGKTVWVPGDGDHAARLLDLEKGKFVDEVPRKECGWLHAVRPDGAVFVSRAKPNPASPQRLFVYRPTANAD
jgi:hypothetical protein